MQNSVLILGASGRFGRHAALAFEKSGWRVRRFNRGRDTLDDVARNADVIVNAFNPAYPDWARDVPRFTQDVIRVARRFGATVIIPGNVYVYGAQTPAPWGATTRHEAQNPLGRIRVEMEQAYANSGVQTIILRAGDFIDTEASGNWFDKVLVKRLCKGVFTYPGRSDIPHAWAFLPDLARACVALAQRRGQMPVFSDIPYSGYTLSGDELRAGMENVVGYPVRLKSMSYLPLVLARPFWRMAQSLLEMRYLWMTPHWLNDQEFKELLPDLEVTPLEQALAKAIQPQLGQRQVDPDQTMTARA